jgi:hypothetical protein
MPWWPPFADRIAGTFRDAREHVPLEIAGPARAIAGDAGADALLAIGGGSTVGAAKAIALPARIPILAVPTTYAGGRTLDHPRFPVELAVRRGGVAAVMCARGPTPEPVNFGCDSSQLRAGNGRAHLSPRVSSHPAPVGLS